MQTTRDKSTLQPSNVCKTTKVFFASSFLSCMLLAGVLSIASAPAQAQSSNFDTYTTALLCGRLRDPNKKWRCQYTKGKYYAPFAGVGPKPSKGGTRQVLGEGIRYVRYGSLRNKRCLPRVGTSNFRYCVQDQHVISTMYYTKAETAQTIARKSADTAFYFDWFRDIAGAGLVAATIGFANNERVLKITLVSGFVMELVVSNGKKAFEYFVGDARRDISRRGMCYYSVTSYQREVNTIVVSGRVGHNSIGQRPKNAVTYFGWYAPEYEGAACK